MSHHQVTIRYDDDELDQTLQREAEAMATTKEVVALRLIRRGVEQETPSAPKRIGDSLRQFQGSLSEEDHQSILEAVAEQDAVDLARWTQ